MLKRPFVWFLEKIKAASDIAMLFFLRSTSRFGSELTDEGKAEQGMWRERRLRNIRGLALMSRGKRSGPKE